MHNKNLSVGAVIGAIVQDILQEDKDTEILTIKKVLEISENVLKRWLQLYKRYTKYEYCEKILRTQNLGDTYVDEYFNIPTPSKDYLYTYPWYTPYNLPLNVNDKIIQQYSQHNHPQLHFYGNDINTLLNIFTTATTTTTTIDDILTLKIYIEPYSYSCKLQSYGLCYPWEQYHGPQLMGRLQMLEIQGKSKYQGILQRDIPTQINTTSGNAYIIIKSLENTGLVIRDEQNRISIAGPSSRIWQTQFASLYPWMIESNYQNTCDKPAYSTTISDHLKEIHSILPYGILIQEQEQEEQEEEQEKDREYIPYNSTMSKELYDINILYDYKGFYIEKIYSSLKNLQYLKFLQRCNILQYTKYWFTIIRENTTYNNSLLSYNDDDNIINVENTNNIVDNKNKNIKKYTLRWLNPRIEKFIKILLKEYIDIYTENTIEYKVLDKQEILKKYTIGYRDTLILDTRIFSNTIVHTYPCIYTIKYNNIIKKKNTNDNIYNKILLAPTYTIQYNGLSVMDIDTIPEIQIQKQIKESGKDGIYLTTLLHKLPQISYKRASSYVYDLRTLGIIVPHAEMQYKSLVYRQRLKEYSTAISDSRTFSSTDKTGSYQQEQQEEELELEQEQQQEERQKTRLRTTLKEQRLKIIDILVKEQNIIGHRTIREILLRTEGKCSFIGEFDTIKEGLKIVNRIIYNDRDMNDDTHPYKNQILQKQSGKHQKRVQYTNQQFTLLREYVIDNPSRGQIYTPLQGTLNLHTQQVLSSNRYNNDISQQNDNDTTQNILSRAMMDERNIISILRSRSINALHQSNILKNTPSDITKKVLDSDSTNNYVPKQYQLSEYMKYIVLKKYSIDLGIDKRCNDKKVYILFSKYGSIYHNICNNIPKLHSTVNVYPTILQKEYINILPPQRCVIPSTQKYEQDIILRSIQYGFQIPPGSRCILQLEYLWEYKEENNNQWTLPMIQNKMPLYLYQSIIGFGSAEYPTQIYHHEQQYTQLCKQPSELIIILQSKLQGRRQMYLYECLSQQSWSLQIGTFSSTTFTTTITDAIDATDGDKQNKFDYENIKEMYNVQETYTSQKQGQQKNHTWQQFDTIKLNNEYIRLYNKEDRHKFWKEILTCIEMNILNKKEVNKIKIDNIDIPSQDIIIQQGKHIQKLDKICPQLTVYTSYIRHPPSKYILNILLKTIPQQLLDPNNNNNNNKKYTIDELPLEIQKVQDIQRGILPCDTIQPRSFNLEMLTSTEQQYIQLKRNKLKKILYLIHLAQIISSQWQPFVPPSPVQMKLLTRKPPEILQQQQQRQYQDDRIIKANEQIQEDIDNTYCDSNTTNCYTSTIDRIETEYILSNEPQDWYKQQNLLNINTIWNYKIGNDNNDDDNNRDDNKINTNKPIFLHHKSIQSHQVLFGTPLPYFYRLRIPVLYYPYQKQQQPIKMSKEKVQYNNPNTIKRKSTITLANPNKKQLKQNKKELNISNTPILINKVFNTSVTFSLEILGSKNIENIQNIINGQEINSRDSISHETMEYPTVVERASVASPPLILQWILQRKQQLEKDNIKQYECIQGCIVDNKQLFQILGITIACAIRDNYIYKIKESNISSITICDKDSLINFLNSFIPCDRWISISNTTSTKKEYKKNDIYYNILLKISENIILSTIFGIHFCNNISWRSYQLNTYKSTDTVKEQILPLYNTVHKSLEKIVIQIDECKLLKYDVIVESNNNNNNDVDENILIINIDIQYKRMEYAMEKFNKKLNNKYIQDTIIKLWKLQNSIESIDTKIIKQISIEKQLKNRIQYNIDNNKYIKSITKNIYQLDINKNVEQGIQYVLPKYNQQLQRIIIPIIIQNKCKDMNKILQYWYKDKENSNKYIQQMYQPYSIPNSSIYTIGIYDIPTDIDSIVSYIYNNANTNDNEYTILPGPLGEILYNKITQIKSSVDIFTVQPSLWYSIYDTTNIQIYIPTIQSYVETQISIIIWCTCSENSSGPTLGNILHIYSWWCGILMQEALQVISSCIAYNVLILWKLNVVNAKDIHRRDIKSNKRIDNTIFIRFDQNNQQLMQSYVLSLNGSVFYDIQRR